MQRNDAAAVASEGCGSVSASSGNALGTPADVPLCSGDTVPKPPATGSLEPSEGLTWAERTLLHAVSHQTALQLETVAATTAHLFMRAGEIADFLDAVQQGEPADLPELEPIDFPGACQIGAGGSSTVLLARWGPRQYVCNVRYHACDCVTDSELSCTGLPYTLCGCCAKVDQMNGKLPPRTE